MFDPPFQSADDPSGMVVLFDKQGALFIHSLDFQPFLQAVFPHAKRLVFPEQPGAIGIQKGLKSFCFPLLKVLVQGLHHLPTDRFGIRFFSGDLSQGDGVGEAGIELGLIDVDAEANQAPGFLGFEEESPDFPSFPIKVVGPFEPHIALGMCSQGRPAAEGTADAEVKGDGIR